MKRATVFAVLLIAACSKAPTDYVDSDGYRKAEAQVFLEKVRAGERPEQAKAELAQVREFTRKLDNDPEVARDLDRKARDLVKLHTAACQSDPAMAGCS